MVVAGEAGAGLGVSSRSSPLASATFLTRVCCIFLNGRKTTGEERGKTPFNLIRRDYFLLQRKHFCS